MRLHLIRHGQSRNNAVFAETVGPRGVGYPGRVPDLCTAHAGTDDVVGLVSHQYFGQFVLAAVLGLGGPPWRRFRIDNTAHVAIDFVGAHPQIAWVNRCDHLAPCDVTN